MGIFRNLKCIIDNYFAKKQEGKKFMDEVRKEALEESKEEIKAAIKKDIIDKKVKALTSTRGDRIKKAFSLDAFGDTGAKLERMTGKKEFDVNKMIR